MGLELQLQHWGVSPYHHRKAKPSCSNARRRTRRIRRSVFWTLWEWNNAKRSQCYHHIPPNHYYCYNKYKYNYALALPPNSSIPNITSRKNSSSSSSSKISTTVTTCLLKLGFDDVAAVAHNKVLIAALTSAAVGQLSKPFTSKLLSGRDFDLRAAFQAGGFPSTHSSAVVATATSLALERGFSDSIFGLAVVYAGLVMYDAQGVRREVGNHARVLNKVVLREAQANSTISRDTDVVDDLADSRQRHSSYLKRNDSGPLLSEDGWGFAPNSKGAPLLLESDDKKTTTSKFPVSSSSATAEERTEEHPSRAAPLKESIGHSEVDVMAGALLGFFVSMAVYSVM